METLIITSKIRQLVLSNISVTYNNTLVHCTTVLVNISISLSCSPDILLGVQGEDM